MIVRIRLGSSLARLTPAPLLSLELPDGATVEDLFDLLARRTPAAAAALPLSEGQRVERGRHPGVVRVPFRAPTERLEACGLLRYAVEQYG